MLYFTPGPSQLYPTVPDHIQIALDEEVLSLSHRSKKFQEIYEETVNNLRKLLQIPQTHEIFFLSSSLEAMERIIQNCVLARSLHFTNGFFSQTFFDFACKLGKDPDIVEVKAGKGFNLKKIKIFSDIELVAFTHNETSTGVMIPFEEIHNFARRYPKQYIALDTVSSMPDPQINFSLIDLVFFSVQKGFGLPAGLAVLVVSPRALERSVLLEKEERGVGTYHSFSSLLEKGKKHQTPETPNVLGIYLLGKVAQDMNKKEIRKIRKETEKKAQLLYQFAENHKKFEPFVKEKRFRSNTTIVIDVKGRSKQIIETLKKKGYILGSGYGEFKEKHIRIANFPAHKIEDIKALIEELKKF